MPIYIDPKATKDFVFSQDAEVESPPVFQLAQPTLTERDEIEAALLDDDRDVLALTRNVISACLRGWTGWEGEYEANKDGRVSDASYGVFAMPDRAELMTACLEHMGLSVADQD